LIPAVTPGLDGWPSPLQRGTELGLQVYLAISILFLARREQWKKNRKDRFLLVL
jgi:hypothetical protein